MLNRLFRISVAVLFCAACAIPIGGKTKYPIDVFYGTDLPDRALREQVASALDVLVQVSRLSDGTRRVMSITEVTGIEGETVQLQEIFRFRRVGIAADGRVTGAFEPTGVRPRFADRIRLAGIELSQSLFLD